jgi:hypothetical protein
MKYLLPTYLSWCPKVLFSFLHHFGKECGSYLITYIVGSAYHNKLNPPIKCFTPPQFDAWIAICYLMQDKFMQCSVVWATLENNTTFANFRLHLWVLHELCFKHAWTCQKKQSTMAWSRINRTHTHNWMKPPNLQPLPLLCFTDVAVSSEHAPLGHSWSNWPIFTSHHLQDNLNFSIMVPACSTHNGTMHAICCCCNYSTCIHLKWRVSKNVLTCLQQFYSSLILIFISYTVTFPSTPMWTSQAPAWIKKHDPHTLLPTTTTISHLESRLRKMPFHFL